jgi:hypothetical protein
LNQALAPYFYTPPYSLINPLPGLLGPAVVGAANHPINPVSGEIVLSPNQSGTFVTVIKVTSYRCGQKIAEIYRDFSLKIIPLPANYPPVYNLNTPSTNPSYFYQQRPPQIRSELKDAAGNDVFSYKFFANDTVKIKLKVEDILPIYSGNPSDYPNSPLALNGFYTAFNSNQIGFGNNPGACNFPPCMTLRGPNDPPLPAPAITVPTTQFLYPGGPVIGTGFDQRGFTQGGGQISWIPGCNNLLPSDSFSAPANQISKKFLVQATALDLICPIPGLSSKVIEIEIFNLPKLQAPIFRNYHFDEQLNRFSVSFIQPLDTLSVDPIDSINFPNLNQNQVRQISVERRRKSFVSYKLYRAIIPAGSPLLVSGNPVAPFQLVGEIFDIDSTIFLDVAPFNTTLFDYYYFVVNTSTCKELVSTSTDTIRLENPARIEINPFLSSCLDQKTGFGVSLSNFNATLGSMSLVLQYDSTKLRFHSIRNVNPRLTGTFVNNALNNQIRVAWYSTDSIWVNGTMNLFEIIFYSTDTGNISISWNTNETSITDNLGGALSVIGIPITKFFIKCPTYRGSLLYKNSLNSPLINSRIRLQNQGSALFLDTITNTQGNFNFGPVEPGLYNLTFQPNIGWGGVNGTDALLTVLHYVLINPMNGLNLQAADVNYNQLINAADALTMSRRAVGQIGGFMSGDWVYNRSSIQLFPNDTLVLNNILALCYGDVNGSYILNSQPREIFNEIPHLSNISVKSSELQLYLDEPTEIGALTIHLNLPNNTIVGDVVSSCSSGQLVYHQTGQSLKIVWYSAEGCSTKSSEPLLRIKYIGPDPQKLELGSESELANRFGQPIHGVDFRWAGPKTNTQPFVRVYPNPSSDIFYLQGKSPYYQLTDLLGRPILDGFNLNGESQIDLTAKPRGMYFLNLIEENGQKSMHKLILK